MSLTALRKRGERLDRMAALVADFARNAAEEDMLPNAAGELLADASRDLRRAATMYLDLYDLLKDRGVIR